MDHCENRHVRDRETGIVLSAAVTALAALLLDAFYVYIQYSQNPADLQQPRVHFWIAYTLVIAFAAAIGCVYPGRLARITLVSLSAWGALICAVIGIFSIGLLYLIPLGLALTALGRITDKRLELADLAVSGGAFVAMVWIMTEGLQLFPLA